MYDLLVIGAGLSGLSAALCASQAGLKACIIAKGMGAHHWTPGTIDVLGYLPDEPAAVVRPFDALNHLPDGHPYRILGAERVRASLDKFRTFARLDDAGYSSAMDDVNVLLPTPAGALRPTWLAPAAQMAGANAVRSPTVIVGVEGLRDFYPHLIADNLCRQGAQARAATIPWSTISEERDRNAIQLATTLDDPARVAPLASALRKVVKPGELVGLPAILGIGRHLQLIAQLQEALTARIFEIPMLPPSVPGIRLFRCLPPPLASKGVRVEANMEVCGFGVEHGRITWVDTATSARPLRHYAKNFLLATGGILGGGFNSDPGGRVWDTVFDLPLTVPQERSKWFAPSFLDVAGQPVYTGGVRVDARFQPLDDSGNVVYSNLWAAGGCLSGADPIRERSFEGIAVATGVAAIEQMIAS